MSTGDEKMNECKDCEIKGYSQELCSLHKRNCKRQSEGGVLHNTALSPYIEKWEDMKEQKDLGVKTIAGMGVGLLAATVGLAVAPIVGVKAIAHVAALKVSGSVVGAGAGYWSGKSDNKEEKHVS